MAGQGAYTVLYLPGLEKMALVRQQLGRQCGVVLRTYDTPEYAGAAKGGGGPLADGSDAMADALGVANGRSVRASLGGGGQEGSKEARELDLVHDLQKLMPMKDLLLTKYASHTPARQLEMRALF